LCMHSLSASLNPSLKMPLAAAADSAPSSSPTIRERMPASLEGSSETFTGRLLVKRAPRQASIVVSTSHTIPLSRRGRGGAVGHPDAGSAGEHWHVGIVGLRFERGADYELEKLGE